MANETGDNNGNVIVDGVYQGQQVTPSIIAPDGTIVCSNCEAELISVSVADVDLLLSFSDGTHIIIPNGALDAISDALHPVVFFDKADSHVDADHATSDHKSTLGDLFKMVGITKVAEGGSLRVVSENIDVEKTEVTIENPPTREIPPAEKTMSISPIIEIDSGDAASGKGPGPGASTTSAQPIEPTDDDPVVPTITPRPTVYQSAQEILDLTDPTVTLDDNITADDIVNIVESEGSVAITGVVGGSAEVGDTVTLTLSSDTEIFTYTGEVLENKTFSIEVLGEDLVIDSDFVIDAIITVDGADNPGD